MDAKKDPEIPINTNVYRLSVMFPGVFSQWFEIGTNGVEKANNGNRWQLVAGICPAFSA